MEQFHEENIVEQIPDEVPAEFLEQKKHEPTFSGLDEEQRKDLKEALRLFKIKNGLE